MTPTVESDAILYKLLWFVLVHRCQEYSQSSTVCCVTRSFVCLSTSIQTVDYLDNETDTHTHVHDIGCL